MFRKKELVYDNEITGYREVRMEKGGNVLLGGASAAKIETERMADYYEMDIEVSNFSADGMTLCEASDILQTIIEEKMPERLILHLGEADLESFEQNEAGFDRAYLQLIENVRMNLKKCAICLVTLKNDNHTALIEKMNRHITNIADAERCSVVDINSIKESDAETCKTVAFVYELGFMGSLNRSVSDQTLVKMIYSKDLAVAAETAEETETEKRYTPDPVFRVMGALA